MAEFEHSYHIQEAGVREQQKGIFTLDTLTPKEKELVTSVVNWENFSGYTNHIDLVHGRSITFQSPSRSGLTDQDYMQGDFDGLQVFGAGGSISGLRSGIFENDKTIILEPVNPTNHAEELAQAGITQLRKIDENGHLHLWDRPYAPMHGMDQKEAEARKKMTSWLSSMIYFFGEKGEELPFVVPELAAEGYFPELKDSDGNSLRFQTYRVPLLPRLPYQFFKTSTEDGEGHLEVVASASELFGETLSLLHLSGRAYMDGHPGNMSLLTDSDKRKLFITDLGSIEDVSAHPFLDQYRGFDILQYLVGWHTLTTSLAAAYQEMGCSEETALSEAGQQFGTSTINLLWGYFQNDIIEEAGKKNISPRQILNVITDTVASSFARYADGSDPAKFIRDFAAIYKQISQD